MEHGTPRLEPLVAVASHLAALRGSKTAVRLSGQFSNMLLHVLPLPDEAGESMGCISTLNSVDK
jgi:hypothetical protein